MTWIFFQPFRNSATPSPPPWCLFNIFVANPKLFTFVHFDTFTGQATAIHSTLLVARTPIQGAALLRIWPVTSGSARQTAQSRHPNRSSLILLAYVLCWSLLRLLTSVPAHPRLSFRSSLTCICNILTNQDARCSPLLFGFICTHVRSRLSIRNRRLKDALGIGQPSFDII